MSKLISASEQSAAAGWVARHGVTWLVVAAGLVGVSTVLAGSGYVLTFTGWAGVVAGLVVARHVAGVGLWVHRRRRLLAKASLPAPGMPRMLGDLWREKRRVAYLRKQWPAVCQVHSILGVGKTVPRLHKIRSTVEGDIQCLVSPGPIGVKGGVDKISANAPMIAETCGCLEVLVKRTGVGHAVLTFMWTEAMERVLPVAELPKAPRGRVAYGVRRDGSAASIDAALSVLVAGLTGSGKSGVTWALLADMIRQGMHVDLYASDPKGGIELGPLADKVGERHGTLKVVDYCTSADETKRLIDKVERAMKERQADQTGRKWTVNDAAVQPLIVLLIDESVEVMAVLKTAGPANNRAVYLTKLKTIISQGRASGVMVLALTQMAQKEVVGEVRDMFAQRLSLAQRNAINTAMILGDGAEEMGARCSQIVDRPGLGYSYDETRRGYELFRAAWCDDADIERIAAGLLPDGMDTGIGKAPVNRQCAIYHFFTSDDQCVYVGVSVDPGRRRDEHAGVGGKAKPWWPYVDESRTRIVWADSEAAARVVEERHIKKFQPFGNDQHNRSNPHAGRAPIPLPSGRRGPAGPMLDVVEGATVTEIRRPVKEVRSRSRRRVS